MKLNVTETCCQTQDQNPIARQNLFERGVSSKNQMNETTEPLFSVFANTGGNPIPETKIGLASPVAAPAHVAQVAEQTVCQIGKQFASQELPA